MSEWIVKIPDELAKELEDCFAMGPIIDEIGTRYLTEEVFDRLNLIFRMSEMQFLPIYREANLLK